MTQLLRFNCFDVGAATSMPEQGQICRMDPIIDGNPAMERQAAPHQAA
jgi:hypothetical protein